MLDDISIYVRNCAPSNDLSKQIVYIYFVVRNKVDIRVKDKSFSQLFETRREKLVCSSLIDKDARSLMF